MPLGRFMEQCFMMTSKWSREYSNKTRVFVIKPTIDLPLWTTSYHWVKSDKAIICDQNQNGFNEYIVPTGEIKIAFL